MDNRGVVKGNLGRQKVLEWLEMERYSDLRSMRKPIVALRLDLSPFALGHAFPGLLRGCPGEIPEIARLGVGLGLRVVDEAISILCVVLSCYC